jgi:hypothetical protein
MLLFLPLPAILGFFWSLVSLLAAGFLAVYLYHRRTGEFLSVRNGARMGMLTGLFSFVIMLVLMVPVAVTLSSDGGLGEGIREQIRKNASGASMDEAMRMLDNPSMLAFVLVMVVAVYFVMFTSLTMIGGARGAKVMEKE